MTTLTGRCFCGAVRSASAGEPDLVGVRHCLNCRKHHGAPFYAAAVFQSDAVKIEGKVNE